MLLILLALLASRGSGLVRDAIVAYQFGTTATTDSFIAAFSLPDILSSLLLAGLVGVALIPILVRASAEDPANRWMVASSVLNLMTLGAAALALVGIVFARPLVTVLTPGLAGAHAIRAAHLLQVMFPALVFFGAGSVFTAILNAGNRFTVPNLAGLFVNLAMILGAVAFGPRIGIDALAWGFLVGSILQLAIQLPSARRLGFRYRLTLGLSDPRVRAVLASVVPLTLILVFAYSRLLVERWLGSLIAPGTISVLTFSNRLLLVAPTLLVAPVSTVLYPQLARHVIDNQPVEVREVISTGIRLILLGVLPAALLLRFLSHPIVAAVYQRGAFDLTSSNATAYLLGLFALALVPFSLNDFMTRSYFARGRQRFALRAALAGMLLTFVGDIVLTRLLGFPGLAWGATFGAWSLLAIFVVDHRMWRQRSLIVPTLKTVVASVAMILVAIAVFQLTAPFQGILARLAVTLLAAGAVYVGALLLVASEDARLLGGMASRWALRALPQ